MKKLMFSLICIVISITLPLQQGVSEFVTDGLVSYWTFDKAHIRNNKLKDLWGNNDGTSFGNPKIVQGKVGDALKFDGEENYLNMTNLGDFGSQLGSSTFEAWIIVGHKNDRMSLMYVRDSCMEWVFSIWTGGGLDNIQTIIAHKVGNRNHCHGYVSGLEPLKLSDGKWHHLVYSYEIMNENVNRVNKKMLKIRVYVDGKPLLDSSYDLKQPATFIPFEKPLYLGGEGRLGARTRFFKGVIDEVRIYNRALTHEEVTQNYKTTTPYSVEPIKKLPVVWGLLKSKN